MHKTMSCLSIRFILFAAFLLPLYEANCQAENFSPTSIILINFETGAPCYFAQTTALTNAYAGQGVTFSGPGAKSGGAILDQCGGFGINAHSGTDYLAFNTLATYTAGGTAAGPETITFTSPVTNVSIFVGGADTLPTYTLNAYNGSNVLLTTSSASPTLGQWVSLSSSAANIASLKLTFTSGVGVVDDLSFTTATAGTPEPTSVVLVGSALLGLFALRRRNGETGVPPD
jgi:hypothetical protein